MTNTSDDTPLPVGSISTKLTNLTDQVKETLRAKREQEKADAEAKASLQRRNSDRVQEDGSVAPASYTQDEYDAAFADARAVIDDQLKTTRRRHGAMRYIAAMSAIVIGGLAAIYHLNGEFAPQYYKRDFSEKVADAFDNGSNYGVFDLNIDIRNLRDAHLAKLDKTPDVVLLGASHWQEADAGLVTDRSMYNAHIHRDYYEDPLGMIEMLERNDRLPDTLILTIRDNQFTPVAKRTDFLWLPGIPYYRRMAKRLGLKAHHPIETAPVVHWRDRLSLDLLHNNAKRWFEEPVAPGPTKAAKMSTLDLLLPDGSIVWSHEHDAVFTQERMRKETLDFAAMKRNSPPILDPKGVKAIHTLLRHLHSKGVRVYLAHPPFNPLYWDAVQGSPYMDGLQKVKSLVQGWADEFGWEIVGGFDPNPLGCRADQYIDAEHANRDCLSAIFQQFMTLDRAHKGLPPLDEATPEAPVQNRDVPIAGLAPNGARIATIAAPVTARATNGGGQQRTRVLNTSVQARRTPNSGDAKTADWRHESAPRIVTIQLRASFD